MISSVFELLFKYRPALFEQGGFAFVAPGWVIGVAAVLGLLAGVAALRYRKVPSRARSRAVLISLRLSAFAILLFCLLQPALVLTSVVPQQSVVGVVVDDSLSMQIPDMEGVTRADYIAGLLDPETNDAIQVLNERFKARMFSFSSDARRVSGTEELSFKGSRSRIGRALGQAAEELAGLPLAGLVLLTDGAATAGDQLSDVLLELRSSGVKVFPVPIGQKRFSRDVEVSRVDAPRSVLRGSSLQAEVTLAQTGFNGEKVVLEIEDNGRLVSSQEVSLPADGEALVVTTTFAAETAGTRRFSFRVVSGGGELLEENNLREVLIEVADRREKILYFEGEPRHEVGFMRRAVADDEGLQLVVLARLAENRLYRLELDDKDELAGGFPTTREELFKYRGLILGSIEASYFTYDQMRMIADFVGKRGGGLLFLGGRRAFAEGGYRDTPLAEVIPLALGPGSGGEGEPFFSMLQVSPTQLGLRHPATQLADDRSMSEQLWPELPMLSTFNPLTRLRPGATALLVAQIPELGEEQVVLAHQRYGRGRALALTVHDTWHWQMSRPLEDRVHERFWKQLLRWLVSYVPSPIQLAADRDRAQIGEPVRLTATIRDDTFLDVNNAIVEATIRAPSGEESEVLLDWVVEEDGKFQASFVPRENGLYQIAVAAESQGRSLGEDTLDIESTELREEMFSAEVNQAFLERVADETGGRIYRPEQLGELFEDLAYSQEGSTVREYRELWDMPVLFLLLLSLLVSEWALRRKWGLA